MIGTVDPVSVVGKLRKKTWPALIISVGPAKEPEKKKEEPKKDEAKKEEPKKEEAKEEPKKEEAKKEEGKEEAKKEEPKKEEKKPEPDMQVIGTALQYRPYRPYYPPMTTYYPVHHSMEENPNACVIC